MMKLGAPIARRAARRAVVLVAAAVVGGGVTNAANAATSTFQFSTTPALTPAFNASVSDYVARCQAGTPTQVQVSTPTNTFASVDGGPQRKGTFTASVNVSAGQEFTVSEIQPGKTTTTYYVRCLPSDFPQWTSSRPGNPQAAYYMMAPTFSTGGFAPNGHYVAIFDTDGAPVWWYYDPFAMPGDVKLAPDGNVLFTTLGSSIGVGGQTAEEHSLDGALVRTINAAPTAYNVGIDFHDIQLLPNGDYLVQGGYPHQADLSPYGGPANATIYDDVIQEVTPQGWLMWQWDAMDHIPLTEVDPQWWPSVISGPNPYYDPYHMNSIQQVGNDVIVSFRHLDAVYDVSRLTDQIVWKLGGQGRDTSLPGKQLTILNDPVFACGSHFGGQHDARMLSDGTIALHDNGSNLKQCGSTVNRPPRAVRYQIDLAAGTATMVEQVSDPTNAPRSGCCGSAVRLGAAPTDDWVADWGITPITEELTPTGSIVFQLIWTGQFSYRTYPVMPGVLTRQALRSGMNAQYPR